MKKLLVIFALLAAPLFAAKVTVTFDGQNPPGTVEYFVEQKEGTAWIEKVKGPASPLVYDVDAPTGTVLTVRVRARLLNGQGVSPSSNEVTGYVPPKMPAGAKVEVALIYTLTGSAN